MISRYIFLSQISLILMVTTFEKANCQVIIGPPEVIVEVPMIIEKTLTVKKEFSLLGSLVLDDFLFQITSDNQVLTITDSTKTYIRIGSDTGNASSRTLLLSNGINLGQTIFLECACAAAAWELLDNPSPGGNVNLGANRTFDKGNIIQLVWNGTDWLELHFSAN